MGVPIRSVIEISDRHIKFFRAKKTGDMYVPRACTIEDIGQWDVQKLFSGCSECIVVVPRRLAILRQMRLPAQDPHELAGMVGLRLINTIPFPLEDIIYQGRVLEQDGEGYSRVLVTILPAATSRGYLGHVSALRGIDVKVTLSSYGILEWWLQSHRNQPVAIVNLEERHGEVCFCHEGKLFFSKNLSYGREDVVNNNVARLIDEITDSLDVYARQGLGPVLERIILLLPFREGNDLRAQLEAVSGTPVEIAGPLDKMPRVPPAVCETLSVNGRHSFTAGLGLLLSGTDDPVNLVPAEVNREKQNRLLKRQFLRLAVLVLTALAISVGGEVVDIHAQSESLKALEKKSRELKILATEADEKINFVTQFDRKSQEYRFIPALLEELRLLAPDTISFRTLTLDGSGKLSIEGYAEDHAAVNQMQSGLVRSPSFQNVDLKSATNRIIANRNVTDFRMTAQWSSAQEDGP